MNEKLVIDLYQKEREYERFTFGDYDDNKSLNFGSFLIFLRTYLEKAEEAYTSKWDKKLPPWLTTCKEFEEHGTAPIKAYEEVIKIMALAGATLETYTKIDADKWRFNLEEDSRKWKD